MTHQQWMSCTTAGHIRENQKSRNFQCSRWKILQKQDQWIADSGHQGPWYHHHHSALPQNSLNPPSRNRALTCSCCTTMPLPILMLPKVSSTSCAPCAGLFPYNLGLSSCEFHVFSSLKFFKFQGCGGTVIPTVQGVIQRGDH